MTNTEHEKKSHTKPDYRKSSTNTSLKPKNQSTEDKVQIIPLGGVEEIGINCTAIRYKNKIIVIDAGLGFSDVDHFGVDYLIPNLDYLKQNKDKIEGIFITHGHLDHIGGITHFLKALDFPDVFASPFAAELIKLRLNEEKILHKTKLHIINTKSVLKSDPFEVSYFHVNHSIPESMGIIINTPVGRIVHSGDFKFDNSPLNEDTADFYTMAKTGEMGVRMLLSDSTNSFREGYNVSESKIKDTLEDVIGSAQGRVIVSTFASLVTRLYALVEIAKTTNRKVFITGRSMANSIAIARKLNYITAPDSLFVDRTHFKRYSENRLLILATGSQGENMAAMSRMARGEHREVKIQKGDTVILSSSIIPGNDALVQNLINEITERGAEVFHKDIMNVHTSGHGFVEDQKMMINLFKPEVFMPVHGYQYFLRRHARTAELLGIKKKNVVIAKRGSIVELTKTGWNMAGKVNNNPLLISSDSGGEVRELLVQDREQLASGGIVFITTVLTKPKFESGKDNTKHNYQLAADPHVMSRGFVLVNQNRELMTQIIGSVRKTTEQFPQGGDKYRELLRRAVEKDLASLLYKTTKRRPLIMVNVELI